MHEAGCDACTEMAILDYMLSSYVEGVNMKFPEMAAWSAVSLAAESS